MRFSLACAVILSALVAGAPANAQVPALLQVPEDALEPERSDLRRQRRDLLIRLSGLKQQGQTFNAQCATVDKGSAAGAKCRVRHAELEGLRHKYVADADRFNDLVRRVPRTSARRDKAIPFEVSGRIGKVTVTGNVITTGPRSSVRVRFPDGNEVTVGPDSRFIIEDLKYDPSAGISELAIGITKGAFRLATGKITLREFKIIFTNAFAAVRGTELVGEALAGGGLALSLIAGRVDLTPASGAAAVPMVAGDRVVLDKNGKMISRANEGVPALQRRWSQRMQ